MLASSGSITVSFVFTVKVEEGIQGIGVTIGRVNAQLFLFRWHLELVAQSDSLMVRRGCRMTVLRFC